MTEPGRGSSAATEALDVIATLPGVREAVDAAREACEQLRWHEAYRRRWREVRVEAGVRTARDSAAIDGARVPVDVVRGLAVGADVGPGEANGAAALDGAGRGGPGAQILVATGALRVAAEVERRMPELGARTAAALPPFGQLLGRLHAAAGAGWLPEAQVGRLRTTEDHEDLRGLGPSPAGAEAAARVELLGHLVRDSHAPALVVAAVVHGELLTVRPFVAANGLVARGVFRLLVTTRGLDPTGSVIAESRWAAQPNAYLGAAAGFATGTPQGVAAWVRACADAVVEGAQQARVVADGVLAGTLPH